MEKILEALKEKIGKKQVVTVMGIVAIWCIASTAEDYKLAFVKIVCISIIVIYHSTCQTYLDREKPPKL